MQNEPEHTVPTQHNEMISRLLQLDQAWAQDVCQRDWDTTSGLSQPAHAAAVCTHQTTSYREPVEPAQKTHIFYSATISSAADAATQTTRNSTKSVYKRYKNYTWNYSININQAASAYHDYAQPNHGNRDTHREVFEQATADVVLGHAVGCISRGEDVRNRIERSLYFADSDGARNKILEGLAHLPKQQHSQETEQKDHTTDNDVDTPSEEAQDSSSPCDAATGLQLLTATFYGAMACSVGMALPVLWGAAVAPWALVLTGACVGGVLGYRAALSQPSVGQMAWMLIGWTAIGLGASVASLGVLSLVVSYGIALAMGIGATALCLGGLGSLWSQGIRSATRGDSERTTSPGTPREDLSG